MLENLKDYLRSIKLENETNEDLIKRVVADDKLFNMAVYMSPSVNCSNLKIIMESADFIASI